MKKIFLFIISFCFCFGLIACDENVRVKEKLVVSIDIIDNFGNIINDKIVTLERNESYTINAVPIGKDGNEYILSEKNKLKVIWRCSNPTAVVFSPQQGLTTTLTGSIAPVSAKVTVEFDGIKSAFDLKIVMP